MSLLLLFKSAGDLQSPVNYTACVTVLAAPAGMLFDLYAYQATVMEEEDQSPDAEVYTDENRSCD